MTNKLRWFDCSIDELNARQLFVVLKLRVDVFVVEQCCAYAELDDLDALVSTRHIFALDHKNNAVAAGRVIAPDNKHPVRVGRVVIAKPLRGGGLSTSLMDNLMLCSRTLYPGQLVKLSAQVGVEKIYAAHGFKSASEVYLEDGIPHRDMETVLSENL